MPNLPSMFGGPDPLTATHPQLRGWTIKHDIALLAGVLQHRPVGPHRHARAIAIWRQLQDALAPAPCPFSVAHLWLRLRELYDLGALDRMHAELDGAADWPVVMSGSPLGGGGMMADDPVGPATTYSRSRSSSITSMASAATTATDATGLHSTPIGTSGLSTALPSPDGDDDEERPDLDPMDVDPAAPLASPTLAAVMSESQLVAAGGDRSAALESLRTRLCLHHAAAGEHLNRSVSEEELLAELGADDDAETDTIPFQLPSSWLSSTTTSSDSGATGGRSPTRKRSRVTSSGSDLSDSGEDLLGGVSGLSGSGGIQSPAIASSSSSSSLSILAAAASMSKAAVAARSGIPAANIAASRAHVDLSSRSPPPSATDDSPPNSATTAASADVADPTPKRRRGRPKGPRKLLEEANALAPTPSATVAAVDNDETASEHAVASANDTDVDESNGTGSASTATTSATAATRQPVTTTRARRGAVAAKSVSGGKTRRSPSPARTSRVKREPGVVAAEPSTAAARRRVSASPEAPPPPSMRRTRASASPALSLRGSGLGSASAAASSSSGPVASAPTGRRKAAAADTKPKAGSKAVAATKKKRAPTPRAARSTDASEDGGGAGTEDTAAEDDDHDHDHDEDDDHDEEEEEDQVVERRAVARKPRSTRARGAQLK
ncbi:hypothetical protein BC828DRAFT_394281 [Blastocladiella britannica]|nr:hypothetical protein BC828DRAFT_394281 [Blastocladiella britannica]